jgi:hypothetical protein
MFYTNPYFDTKGPDEWNVLDFLDANPPKTNNEYSVALKNWVKSLEEIIKQGETYRKQCAEALLENWNDAEVMRLFEHFKSLIL